MDKTALEIGKENAHTLLREDEVFRKIVLISDSFVFLDSKTAEVVYTPKEYSKKKRKVTPENFSQIFTEFTWQDWGIISNINIRWNIRQKHISKFYNKNVYMYIDTSYIF